MFGSSPELIAAYHVFHRLSAPEHPPGTLCSLITVFELRLELPCLFNSCRLVSEFDCQRAIPSCSRRLRRTADGRSPRLRTISTRRGRASLDACGQVSRFLESLNEGRAGLRSERARGSCRMNLVEVRGLEPLAFEMQTRCSSHLSYTPFDSCETGQIVSGSDSTSSPLHVKCVDRHRGGRRIAPTSAMRAVPTSRFSPGNLEHGRPATWWALVDSNH